jgi:predicted dehydrogenase
MDGQPALDFEADFDGRTYERPRDHDRLFAQLTRVRGVMADHAWHTLDAIAARTADPPASVSARLRDLRKAKFGHLTIERRYLDRGLFEYRWPEDTDAA